MGQRADGIDQQSLLILAQIDEQADPRKAWGQVKRRIDALRESGTEVPTALVRAERNLMTELMSQSQGR